MSIRFQDAEMPPSDIEAEKATIGSMLFAVEAVDVGLSTLSDTDFYSFPAQVVFQTIRKMREDQVVIDVVTLASYLQDQRQLEEVGGVQYLEELMSVVPHHAHVSHYAKIVREKSLRRNMIYLSRKAIRDAHNGEHAIQEVMSDMSAGVDDMFGKTSGDARGIREVVASMKMKQSVPLLRQSTGLKDLDAKLRGGLRAGQLVIVAARPGMGKTAFGVGLCEAAASDGSASMIIPLEMDGEELTERIQRQGPERLDEICAKPIYVEDRQFDLENICGSIQMAVRRKAVRFVVIDYLTLIEIESRMNQNEKVEKITRRLKRLAKSLAIPIVVLAQLNRDLEKRENKRPQLSDLRGSGAIEQDADIVLFLYRHEVYYQDEKPGKCEVIIGKHRNGETAIVEVGFLKEQTRFVPIEQIPVDIDITGLFENKPF